MNPDLSARYFYLGSRGWGGMDFDGRVRRCTELGIIQLVGRRGKSRAVAWVTVDPPLPGRPDKELEEAARERGMAGMGYGGPARPKASEVLMLPRSGGSELNFGQDIPVEVDTWRLLEDARPASGHVHMDVIEVLTSGVTARLPELLPSLPDRRFNEMFGLLCRFALRVGHADVPPGHREAEHGESLSEWVREMKRHYRAAKLHEKVDPLPREWEEALERVPGWHWD